MKQQLKHLAPYLPFAIKVYIFDDIDSEKKYLQKYPNGPSRREVTIENFDRLLFGEKYKPILHPLSDLTREIEHNGEKFVPNKKIQWLFDEYFDYSEYILNGKLCFNKMEKLLEWHFDIFGLIEQKLAIDINTLNEKL